MGVVAEGGYGIAVNPYGQHFPFIHEVAEMPRLLADMYLCHNVESAVLPLKIKTVLNITQPPSEERAEVWIVDANGSTVFLSDETEYRVNTWSDRFTIHEWKAEDAICRIVQHNGQHDLEDVISYPSFIEPENAILDERVSELLPKTVTSLIVNGNTIKNAVEFVAGYNFKLDNTETVTTAGKARVNKVYIEAVPGYGQGQYPGCVDTYAELKRINGVGPDANGNFVVQAKDCFWTARTGTTSGTGENKKILIGNNNGFSLRNNCLPCCSCDDFVNTYRALKKVHEIYKTISEAAARVRTNHSSNVARLEQFKLCRDSYSPLSISVIPYRFKDSVCAKVAFGLCNSSEACKSTVKVNLDFSGSTDLVGRINPDSLFIYDGKGNKPTSYSIGGEWPNHYVEWNAINQQRLAQVKFDISFYKSQDLTWIGEIPLLDAPNGNFVTKAFIGLIGGNFGAWIGFIDQARFADKGIVTYIPSESTTGAAGALNSTTFTDIGSFSIKLVDDPNPYSVNMKSLHVKYENNTDYYATNYKRKQEIVYSGPLYADYKIPHTPGHPITDSDFVTIQLTARTNGTVIPKGIISNTTYLKVP